MNAHGCTNTTQVDDGIIERGAPRTSAIPLQTGRALEHRSGYARTRGRVRRA
jgi:hypothetical protein